MPVISTSVGLRGLPAIVDPRVVRCDTADEWVAYLSGREARAAPCERMPAAAGQPYDLTTNAPLFDRFLAEVLGEATGV